MDLAVKVVGGDFTWDAPPPETGKGKGKGSKKSAPKTTDTEKDFKDNVFHLKNINMEIQNGQLVAVVGEQLWF